MDRKIAQSVRNRRVIRQILFATVAVAALIVCVAATVRWLRPSVRRTDVQIARVERGSVDATLQATVVMVTHDDRFAQRTVRTIRLFDGRQVA